MVDRDLDGSSGLKLRDMDLFLKEKIVDLWDKAITLSIAGRYKECFFAYRALYHFIEPYSFGSKPFLGELTSTIGDYFKGLGGKDVTVRQKIMFNKQRVEFQVLLEQYMSELPKAFVELDLWLKTTPDYNDFEKRLSEENFGTGLSFVDSKREELCKLKAVDLVDLMSVNSIHDVHARLMRKNVLQM